MRPLSLRTLAIGFAALSLALAGCGGDDETDTSAPSVEQTTSEPAPEASSGLPEQGATALTSEQRQAMLGELNEVALEDDTLTNGATADIYRRWAAPLAEGECKQTLLAGAKTWDGLAAAEESGDTAASAGLGDKILSLSSDVDTICVQ